MNEVIPDDIRAAALSIVQKPYWPLAHEHEVEALADEIAIALLAERSRHGPIAFDMAAVTSAYDDYRAAKMLEEQEPSLEHGIAAGKAWRHFLDHFVMADLQMGDAMPLGDD